MNKEKIIKCYPTQQQYEALLYLNDEVTDEVLFGGAAGGGKSYLGCMWLISMCKKYPGSRWLMGRSKLATLKTTTLVTFFNVCKDMQLLADVDYAFNASSNIITFNNNSVILLKDLFLYPSDPQFDSLGSLEIAGAFIDEVAQISAKAREVVKSRLGWKNPDGSEIKPKLYMSCNPNKGFAYKDFYLPWTQEKLKDTLKFIPALPTSNKYLSEGRKASLENLTGLERKRLLLGEWEYDNDPATMIEYDNIISSFNNDHILVKDNGTIIGTVRKDGSTFRDKAISVDVARLGKDTTIILIWIGLYVVEYKILSKRTTDEVAAVVKTFQGIYNITRNSIIVDADGVGGGVVDQLKGCIEFNNNGRPLHEENYNHLKSQCYYKLAEVINDNELYFKTDDETVQEKVTEELEQVKRKDIDKDGKLSIVPKEIVKQVLGRSPDLSDAMMLRMYFLVKKKVAGKNFVYRF